MDAGLGTPSQVSEAMEIGADGVLLNTAIAKSQNPQKMARAMKLGAQAGRLSFIAGRAKKQKHAEPSSPVKGLVK